MLEADLKNHLDWFVNECRNKFKEGRHMKHLFLPNGEPIFTIKQIKNDLRFIFVGKRYYFILKENPLCFMGCLGM